MTFYTEGGDNDLGLNLIDVKNTFEKKNKKTLFFRQDFISPKINKEWYKMANYIWRSSWMDKRTDKINWNKFSVE